MLVCKWCQELSLENEFASESEAEDHSKRHVTCFPDILTFEFTHERCFPAVKCAQKTATVATQESRLEKADEWEEFPIIETFDPSPVICFLPETEKNGTQFEKILQQINSEAREEKFSRIECNICGKIICDISPSKFFGHMLTHLDNLALFQCLSCPASGKYISNHCRQVHQNSNYRDDRWKFDTILSQKLEECWRPMKGHYFPLIAKKSQSSPFLAPKNRGGKGRNLSGKPVTPGKFQKLAKLAFDRLMRDKRTDTITCKLCQKRFPKGLLVQGHMENHVGAHSGKALYECKICSYKGNAIRKHFKNDHPTAQMSFIDKRAQYQKDLVKSLDLCFPVLETIASTNLETQKQPEKVYGNHICSFARKELGRKFVMAEQWLRCASRSVAIALPSEIISRVLTRESELLSRCGICGLEAKTRSVICAHLNQLHDKSSIFLEDLRYLNDEPLAGILEECFGS